MDDLYSDLDNYEEVNVIEELRNENKDLKLKLDEYAIAMDKLQKDFDKLSSEFKRLEINYSSLLKTARAEVERKTQIITNLNMEKDMLVLNSLQNGKQNLLSLRRNMTMNTKTTNKSKSNKSNDSDIKMNKNSSRELKENSAKLKDFSSERLEENIQPSVDTAQNSNTCNMSKLVNKQIENVESCSDRNSDAKENAIHHKDGYEGSVSAQSGSIKHRRKSMLALSAQEAKFSTDEEWDTDFIAKEQSTSKEYSSRKEYSSKKIERDVNEKQYKKYSEPSNIDDKYYGSYESSRETRKSRTYNRKHDGDKYRGQDKYEYTRKSWRHVSPDRSHRKPPGDFQDSYNQRSGNRNRVLESPPPEKYSNYKRKTREHRMNFERNHSPIEYGNKRHYQSEKQTSKHKMPRDYEESSSKRVRTNSFQRHRDDDDNKRARTNSFNRHMEENDGWYDDVNSMDDETISEKHPDLRSCQSPDFLCADFHLESDHQIKEIKHTATTQLDDPRITSKKYVIRSDDDKVTVCTAVGSRNIDIAPINKSKWNIQQVHVPELLICKPVEVQIPEINEDLYMDIDIKNPVLNSSLESGEISFGPASVPTSMAKELDQKVVKNRCEKSIKNVQELIPKVDDAPKVVSTSYRIPKNKHCDSHSNGDKDLTLPHKPKSSEIHKDHYENIYTKGFKKRAEILDCHDNSFTKNIKDKKQGVNQHDLQRHIISSRKIVEGDLELSDETSDNIELHQFLRKDKENHILNESKQCNNDNTVHKEMQMDDKNQKTIPREQQGSSIFDIQDVDENKKRDSSNKSKKTVKDESQKTNNRNECKLPMIDIQTHETEIKEKAINKENKLVDKNRKPHQETGSKSYMLIDIQQHKIEAEGEANTNKVKEYMQVDKNQKNSKNRTSCQIEQPKVAMIDIQKHAEEIKERANNINKENEREDKLKNRTNNTTDRSFLLDMQPSVEEVKEKKNEIQIAEKNEISKNQSIVDIQINVDNTTVKKKHSSSTINSQQHVEKIKDKHDKKEMHITDKNEKTDQRHKHPSMIDIKDVIEDESDKTTEINQKCNRDIDPTVEEKQKKSENTVKPKGKKKSQKPKETQKKEILEDSDTLQVTAKRRSKKEKETPQEIKNKFTALFGGDSSSLITPEELGINSGPVETIVRPSNTYMTIFEDAQDASDLKEITKFQGKAPNANDALDVKPKIDLSSTKHTTVCKVDVESKNDVVIPDSGVISKVNENLNLEPMAKEADVVKTVIISTGIQPPCSLEINNEPETRLECINRDTNTQTHYDVVPKSREFSLKALATSTPHKEMHDKVTDSEPKAPCIDNNSLHTSEQSDTNNTLDSHTDIDTDVPDVRIFVRRRRKAIKKPTT